MGTYSVDLRASGSAGGTFRVDEISCTAGTFGVPREGGISSTNSTVSFPTGGTQLGSHTSGFVDLNRVHSLYIHSNSFAAYNSLGPRGVRTIVAKVPVNVGYGQLVTYSSLASEHDYIESGVSAISSIQLELRETAG
jgi:hypothetical protein